MTNFSFNVAHVRGDLFLEGGKWKYTILIDMSHHYYDVDMRLGIVLSARSTPSEIRGVVDHAVSSSSEYVLVVLDPCHQYSHPVMLRLKDYS